MIVATALMGLVVGYVIGLLVATAPNKPLTENQPRDLGLKEGYYVPTTAWLDVEVPDWMPEQIR